MIRRAFWGFLDLLCMIVGLPFTIYFAAAGWREERGRRR